MAISLAGNKAQAVKPGITQTAVIQNSSTATTNAVGARTELVRIVASVDCYLEISASPTASNADFLLPAFAVEYFRVEPGVDKVASLRVGSTDGVLYVTECN